MRLYQAGALLPGARDELIRHAGVLVDGSRIVAAGPLDALMAGHPFPLDVVDLGDVTLMPGLVDAHVHLGFDGGPGPVARMKAETDTEQLILMLRSARERSCTTWSWWWRAARSTVPRRGGTGGQPGLPRAASPAPSRPLQDQPLQDQPLQDQPPEARPRRTC